MDITETRKDQIFKALLDMSRKSHTAGDEAPVAPFEGDRLEYHEDSASSPTNYAVSFNYTSGGSDGPVIYGLPDMIRLDDEENVIYRPTLVMSDHGVLWSLPEDLQEKIDAQTPEDVRSRRGAWLSGVENTLHKKFIALAASNAQAIAEDLLHKKGKEADEKTSLEELQGMRVLTSLDQGDIHNVGLQINFPEATSSDGLFHINVELIDSISEERTKKYRKNQDFDYEKNLPLIMEYYLKEILPPEEAEKIKVDVNVTHTPIQVAGLCTSHAQASLREGVPPAETNADYAVEVNWTAKKVKEVISLLGIEHDSPLGQNLNQIGDAVDTDTRRVFYNDPELYHHYSTLPTGEDVGKVEIGTVVLKADDPLLEESDYLKTIPKKGDIVIGKEFRNMLKSRAAARESYKVRQKSLQRNMQHYGEIVLQKNVKIVLQNKKNIERKKRKEIDVCWRKQKILVNIYV